MQGCVYFICHDLHFQIDFQSRTRKLCCFNLFAFSLVCFFPGWLPSQIETWNFPNLVVCGMVWGKVFMPLPLQPIGLREKLWSCFCLCPLFQRIFSKASNPIRHTVRNGRFFSKNYLVNFNDPKCFKIMRNIFWTYLDLF